MLPFVAILRTHGMHGGQRWIRRSLAINTSPALEQRFQACHVCRYFHGTCKMAGPSVLTLQAQDLPQGLIEPGIPDSDAESIGSGYPTVIQQALDNMRKFDNCVVITRVGNFYELYFEQAELYGPLLNLKVAAKRAKDTAVPMAGFPFFQLDRYLKILVQDYGKHVAISEEVANDPVQRVKSGGLLFNREIKRVVTPGTLIDELFLSPSENNYLLAVSVGTEALEISQTPRDPTDVDESTRKDKMLAGLSWLDLSSGDFYTQSMEMTLVSSAIARIRPREIIIDRDQKPHVDQMLKPISEDHGHIVNYFQNTSNESATQDLFPASHAQSFQTEEIFAATLIAEYVKSQMPGLSLRLQTPERRNAEEYMTIDKHSLRGLEIMQTLRDGVYKGSLLHTVKRTCTESGARLLARRLASPSLSIPIINERLDIVQDLIEDRPLLEEITNLLRRTHDSLRLIQKFAFGRGDADDLLRLSQTVTITANLGKILDQQADKQSGIKNLSTRFQQSGPISVAKRIVRAIDQEGLLLRQRREEAETANAMNLATASIRPEEGSDDLEPISKRLKARRASKGNNGDDDRTGEEDIWVMRKDASTTLQKLHETLGNLLEDKKQLRSDLAIKLGAATLSLKMTPGLGHICHVKGKDLRSDLGVLRQARVVSASKSTRSFYVPEWTSLGRKIEEAKLRIRAEEQTIFQDLREDVVKNLIALRRNGAVLDELDVSSSFALLADEYRLRRPTLTDTCSHKIFGGRHLTVEAALEDEGRSFTRNDCVLDDIERIWLITGPNMAGKSTFLRQTALISILAQTGSFVPADHAEIGLVDQIFSRIGSADNVSQEQSTFMVEMLETAHILKHSTRRSFVIMDEVGRGTTPEDGTAVGYAVLNHLHNISKCRVLFATHFHALADMTLSWTNLACYSTNVIEDRDGAFRYDHRVRRGINREPHSLKVARLAGMPESVIRTAQEALHQQRTNLTE